MLSVNDVIVQNSDLSSIYFFFLTYPDKPSPIELKWGHSPLVGECPHIYSRTVFRAFYREATGLPSDATMVDIISSVSRSVKIGE